MTMRAHDRCAAALMGVVALIFAAVAIADEITCDGGKCNGTQFDDTITGSIEEGRHQSQGRQRRGVRAEGQ